MTHEFDTQELRQLINGDFQFRRCTWCDGLGTVWCDNDIGEVVAASSVTPEGIDDCRFYKDYCEDCDGLGGTLIFGRGKY